MAASNITNEIIITAMDRFVWFVLLVVMSHLVTEFTRVTGYVRGNRQDAPIVNDSFIQSKSVASMIFYPGEEYSLYENQMPQYNNIYPHNNYNQNNNNNYNNNHNTNAAIITGTTNAETIANGFPFSFRPLIDSIFEIPISTLRAVNNLVARLTGSYQHQVPSMIAGVHKSANSNNNNNNNEKPEELEAFRSLTNSAMAGETSAMASTFLNSVTAAAIRNNARSTYMNESHNNSDNNNNNNNSSSDENNKVKSSTIKLQRSSLLHELNA